VQKVIKVLPVVGEEKVEAEIKIVDYSIVYYLINIEGVLCN